MIKSFGHLVSTCPRRAPITTLLPVTTRHSINSPKDKNMNMNPGWRISHSFCQLTILCRQNHNILSRQFSLTSKISHHHKAFPLPHQFRRLHAIADSSDLLMEDIYHPEVDNECLKDYVPGGYHPTLIGDTFCSGRYTVVHKLAFGGYSTIWLARDQQRRGYVSLKILTARASSDSHEGEVLHRLMKGSHAHSGKRFIPPLLGQFSFHGLNGYHQRLVEEPSGGSIA